MTDELKAMPERIAEFLRMALPDGPYVLGAIPAAKGDPEVRTFGDADEAAGWAAAMNAEGAHNLYWIHNRLKGRATKKPKESDVLEVLFLHVDCDPPPKLPREGMSAEELAEWNGAERERIVERLAAFDPEPTFIVDSGGGFQAFWRLADEPPLFIGGDPTRIAAAKAYNIHLRDVLGGDKCQSLEHLMRLPGTVNWPDAEKQKRGRTARRAEWVPASGQAYPLAEFTPAADIKAPGKRKKGAAAAERGEVRRLANPDELEQWGVSPRMQAMIVHGEDPEDPDRYSSRSEAMFAVCRGLVECGVPGELIVGIITDPSWPISAHVLAQKREVNYAWDQVEKARAKAAEPDLDPRGRRVLDPSDPYRTAMRLKEELFPDAIHTNDDWFEWSAGAYRDVEDATVEATLYRELDASVVRVKKDEEFVFERFKPNKTKVNEVTAALKGIAHQPANTIVPPVWLDGDGPPAAEIISCRNGLLHVPSGELLEPTPRFFTRNALDIDYAPDAPPPERWEAFLRDIWPEGEVEIELLQDYFGYLLLPDTSRQKMLLMVGPPRSGKGTIQTVLTQLVGPANVCAPSVKSLGAGGFSLQQLLGKQVAFLSDMRMGRGTDDAAVAENLLRITGQDVVSVERKFKEAWTGRLSARFVVSSNELPKLRDNSAALANRFSPLLMERSFLGREDHTLVDRLLDELPGILNWGLAGWRRLRERGRFVLPAASERAIREIQDIGSPVAAFVRECCELGPAKWVVKGDLYSVYVGWCEKSNERPVSNNTFGRDLRTAVAGEQKIDEKRLATPGGREWAYTGIALRPIEEPQPDPSLPLAQGRRGDPY